MDEHTQELVMLVTLGMVSIWGDRMLTHLSAVAKAHRDWITRRISRKPKVS